MKCLLSNWQLELFAALHLYVPLIFLTAAQKFGICQFLTVCLSCVARIFITAPYIHCQLTRPLKNQILGQNQSWIRSRPKTRGTIEPHNCTSLLVGFYSCTFLYIITHFLLFSSACLVWVSHAKQVRWNGVHTQPASICHRRLRKVALARLKDYHLLLKCVMQEVADSTLLVVPHHRSGKVYTTHSHRAEPLSDRDLPATAFLRLSQYMLVTNGRQIHPQCIHLQTSKSDPPPF